MSIDGRFIAKLASELHENLEKGRINKIYQLSRTDFLFVIHKDGQTRQLFLSLSPQIARMHLSTQPYDKPASPTGFCMLLRKYLEGGVIKEIAAQNNDRIVRTVIENHNDFGQIVKYFMIAELMGKYANLILTDVDYLIIDCYKRVSPFDGQQRSFLKGLIYQLPTDEKIGLSDSQAVDTFLKTEFELTEKTLIANIRGMSPLFASSYLKALFNQPKSKPELFHWFVDHPVEPIVVLGTKPRFYYFDIFPEAKEKKSYPTLSKLLDEVFFDSGRLERTKQVSKSICQLINREYEKNRDKLEKLTAELKEARNADILRIYGDLIRQFSQQVRKGDDELKVSSYELGKDVDIKLDRLLTPSQNAQTYFRKYKKAKQAVGHITGQMESTLHVIDYFDLLMVQVESASLNDLLEIAEELKAHHYLPAKSIRSTNKHPNFDIYLDSQSIEIVVGKNNIQNDFITHQLGKANEWWFHAKEIPGAHVLVRATGDLTEATIRAAANLAAYHSKAKFSSSVPVDYTIVKNVKKLPGIPGSFVTISHQKTIYIDPDKSLIDALTLKK